MARGKRLSQRCYGHLLAGVFTLSLKKRSVERAGYRSVATDSSHKQLSAKFWNVDVFPNPASNELNIVSSSENEVLNVEIRDLGGRLILVTKLKLNGLIAKLELDLVNGAYLITVSNQNNEKVVKKLLVSK